MSAAKRASPNGRCSSWHAVALPPRKQTHSVDHAVWRRQADLERRVGQAPQCRSVERSRHRGQRDDASGTSIAEPDRPPGIAEPCPLPVCEGVDDGCAAEAERGVRAEKRVNGRRGQQQGQAVQPGVQRDPASHRINRSRRHRPLEMLGQAERRLGEEGLRLCRQPAQTDRLRIHQLAGMRALDEIDPPVSALAAQNQEAQRDVSQLAGCDFAQQGPHLVRMLLGIVDDQEQPGPPQRDHDRIVRANKARGPPLGAQFLRDLGR
jgi:hypothetical protein